LSAGLVLLALGFSGPDLAYLDELSGAGEPTIERDHAFESTVSGVFVAGDAGRGQSLVVWAIAEGRSCASAVDEWLMGEMRLPRPIAPTDRPMTA
jgi:glutamate synthase (NADPH/NADH) small chain